MIKGNRSLAVITLLSAALLIAPAASAEDVPRSENLPWSYGAGANNDEGWALLSPEFAPCTIGTSQSPVSISYTTVSDLPELSFHYSTVTAQLDHKDHTLVIAPSGDNTVTIDHHDYHLVKIKFHSPSEHPILDQDYPMEIHLIHQDENKKILIVAVLVDYGSANDALKAMLPHIFEKTAELTINLNALLPTPEDSKPLGYYAYSGSLSSPPCTEGVEWRVLKTPITMDRDQFVPLTRVLQRNARLPQPLYLRTISETKY